MQGRPRPFLVVPALVLVAGITACRGEGPAEEPVATDPLTASVDDPTSAAAATVDPASAIPDDFPLAADWPPRPGEPGYLGLQGPDRELPAIDHQPCDVVAADPAFRDRRRADWGDVEDDRSRQLTVYRSEQDAEEALQAIIEVYRHCPERFDGPSWVGYVLQQTSYGDASWSVTATETFDGYRTSYLGVRHLVRVGQAVLVTVDHNEGGFGPPGSLEENVARPVAEARDVIDAMCVFSTTGC
ncbi:hypothetical protein [Nocardioides silvaticus]|uniref:hypothetical protein n=1 Tax=Nocardioides silvaticus TaxID=2201891 RepID=UPI0011B2375A|nr:hypothetical protein [Nocardioides silvaticus]